MSKTTVALVGATGYAGATAASLLLRHPEITLARATSRSYAGKALSDAVPGLRTDLVLHPDADPGDAEVVVVALPHGLAAGLVPAWLEQGRIVIDLGADFRLASAADYRRWYGADHPAPGLLDRSVLGLPELARGALAGSDLVACPGCYSTAAILALHPAVEAGLAEPSVVVDAASGVSGAGRSPALAYQYPEAAEDFRAYAVDGHRHLPEITRALGGPAQAPRVTFVPHLVPMIRGILATCYVTPRPGVTVESARATYLEAYAGEPFVEVVDHPPRTKEVAGTNRCLVHVTAQGDHLVVLAALDNLVKGAAGQAVQALNAVKGWPETTGLLEAVRWP